MAVVLHDMLIGSVMDSDAKCYVGTEEFESVQEAFNFARCVESEWDKEDGATYTYVYVILPA